MLGSASSSLQLQIGMRKLMVSSFRITSTNGQKKFADVKIIGREVKVNTFFLLNWSHSPYDEFR